MKKVKLNKDFDFSNDHMNVIHGKKGEEVDMTENVYENAKKAGVIGKVKGDSPDSDKAPKAEELKDEAPAKAEEKEAKSKETKEVKNKKTKGVK